ncbi:DUF2914 domain-containing protein [Sorangium sp. So ce1036]|uniref:DUF2914 domain-containing protein n=1 Tax=Sorangium sp. So ce1036 TaxID=3133328 RepID=UPI003F002544
MRILALATAALGGAASGCSDPSEAIARIVREEPPALSRAAQERPGSGPEGDAPPSSAPADGVAGAEDSGAERVAEKGASRAARGAAKERRRRSGSATTARAADGAGRGAQIGAEDGGAVAVPELEVVRLVVSRGIAGREPIEAATSFSRAEADRLYAFVELSNKEQAASEIRVTFTPPDGSAPLRIRLPVGAQRRFRTWAATRKARAAGVWSVAVSDAAGGELARASFTITK